MCDCVKLVNEALKPQGVKLVTRLCVNFETKSATLSGPIIATEKISGAKCKKLPDVICNYCPFCGKSKAEKKRKAVKRAKD